ncbi:S24 family peptidase, partial [Enterobacter quasiroggenkampii]|uniref:S24 family peptidase n=1 Tax=Enterobacter quasiroggenkampii TaxID=2497436 RepID=UPI0021D36A0D
PAQDYVEDSLDLNKLVIKHPSATYFVRVSGDSMIGAGISHGDLLVVDRSLTAVHGDIVIAAACGGFISEVMLTRPGLPVIPVNSDHLPALVTAEDQVGSLRLVTVNLKAN